MTTQKSLSELIQFGVKDPILGNLNKLVKNLDIRLESLDQIGEAEKAILDTITDIALVRMNEVFTPLIIAAQQRLEAFGAAFAAESDSSLTVGTGPKVLVLDEDTREPWIIADYVGLTKKTDTTISMLAKVDDYDRETGQLFVTVVGTGGAGTHAGWHVRMSAAPDLAHAGRTDNPHNVTALQVGTYPAAEIDLKDTATVNALIAYVNGLGFMRQSLNLSDLINKPQALANLGGQPIIGYTPLNKGGDTATGTIAAPLLRSNGGVIQLSLDGSKYLQWSGSFYTNHAGGRILFSNENLSGLTDPATARANLQLGSAATVAASAFQPAGSYQVAGNYMLVGSGPGQEANSISIGWNNTDFRFRVSVQGTHIGTMVLGPGHDKVSIGAGGQVFVNDVFQKTFVLDHPSKPDRYLVHACLEGPEVAVFYRGKAECDETGLAQVKLPDYFLDLCDEESATIRLTPIIGKAGDPYPFTTTACTEVKGGYFSIIGTAGSKVHWEVTATRKDCPALDPEPKQADYARVGNGPYTYLVKKRK